MGWLTNRLSDLAGAFVLGDAPVAYMFPDGDASVARLLVHKLIPDVAPAMKGFEDVAISNFNYAALDLDSNPTRMRLNSTVVGVKETDVNHVKIDYVQQGQSFSVSADHCVLACYNGLSPHLCPEMSKEQREGLSYGVKVPFVYANVLLKNGRAFAGLGTTFTQCPYDPFQWVSAAPTVTSGGYQPPQSLDEPHPRQQISKICLRGIFSGWVATRFMPQRLRTMSSRFVISCRECWVNMVLIMRMI